MFKSRNYGKKVQGINELKYNSNENKSKMKENNKFFQALSLPTLCNMNPRSVYNKIDEFHTFVNEEEIDLLFMSESWERDYLTLDQIIKLEDHVVISNVGQRRGKGGRPAIIVNKNKCYKQSNTNSLGCGGSLVCSDSKECHSQ